MSKTVKKIIINTESIDICSIENGVNSIVQLNLEAQEESIKEIFEKYNLNNIINYHFDEKIIRALEENEEQLIDYLQVCRQAAYTKGKVQIPESIPNIEYDLRELKKGIAKVEESEQKNKQIEMFKKAKETQNIFKSEKGKVSILIGIIDKAYFSVQEFLQNRNRKQVQALNPGNIEQIKNIRKDLYSKKYTEKTNVISKEYANKEQLKENKEVQIDELIL